MTKQLALVGGRGYVGAELLGIVARHPDLELALATSSSRAGARIGETVAAWRGRPETFKDLTPDQVVGVDADGWVLALPNGQAPGWTRAIEAAHPDAVVLDVSGDHRFDPDWSYGLTELVRERIRNARRISNPGCYATGAQLGLAPLAEELAAPPTIFGVSGYSGAGRAPSARNDPRRLAGGLIPYALTGHLHEREIGHRLGREVRFYPHVAGFFRGISLTLSLVLEEPRTRGELLDRFSEFYRGEPYVTVQEAVPEVGEVRRTPKTVIGGFSVDERDPCRLAFVVVLDNLLKGAASQAVQNLNLAFGLDETEGVPT